MKNFILNLLFVALFLFVNLNVATSDRARLYNSNDLDNNWSQFKIGYKKKYSNESHETRRKNIFKNNLQIINELNTQYNNGKLTYKSGVTPFSDWTPDEFLSYVKKGYRNNKQKNSRNSLFNSLEINNTARANLPASVDWRTKGVVNAIKNQGNCGSCWAFSAVGTVESFAAISSGKLQLLSEQNLVDCVGSYLGNSGFGTGVDGCEGGWEHDGLTYIRKNGGIQTSATYPYTSGSTGFYSGSCKYNPAAKSNIQVTNYVSLPFGNENSLQQALANNGPISVAIEVTPYFQYYVSGIFKDTTCRNSMYYLNHAVILVGYDTDLNGNQYYILRNSWGTSWGMNGYMQFARNNNNMCGIATDAIYPNVVVTGSSTTSAAPTKTTTKKPTIAAISSSRPVTSSLPSSGICTNGNLYGAYSGCAKYYNCAEKITSGYFCPTGYLFDHVSQLCKLKSTVTCNPSMNICPIKNAYYPLPGCVNVYYCGQTITNLTAPSGYLFNPSTRTLEASGSFTCPL